MTTRINIDGRIVAEHEAVIPVFDRGFLYGDSIYEVTRTAGGKPFLLDEHLDRLRRSGHGIGMELAWSNAELAAEVVRTLAATGNPESYLRIVITRGAGEIGLDPALADRQRLVIIAKELKLPPASAYRDGVQVAVVGVQRISRRAVDPAVKSGNYLNSVLAVAEARRAGAYEAVMLDAKGAVTEGSSSNIFVIKQLGPSIHVQTPSLETGILEGITRRLVLSLAREAGLEVEETTLYPEDLYSAAESFLTSSVRGVVPIVRVDETVVGDGHPGPVTRMLMARYDERLQAAARAG